ncbi:hypothetical protein SAMN05216174_104202 [Actinokineospora iranica]|uniref:Uncharacterized protein n=2 Tax=Actinokineospora iranica TaxID=1271860 RepID=A0A1G6PC97_9PSEU|nr:hypothetical protein SAMN05216174_104202 [Actinokineospora iranica]
MPTIADDALEGISSAVWTRLAVLANKNKSSDQDDVTAAQMKKLYCDSIQNFHKNPDTTQTVQGPEQIDTTAPQMVIGPYSLTVVDSISVSVGGEFTAGDATSWSANLTASLMVSGRTVWTTSYNLSPENYYVRYTPNVGIAKADITVGFFGQKLCFTASGNACYWWFGFRCTDFNSMFYCLRG